ncbi:CRISPR-associated protein Cas1 [Caldicellulosiruptor acetigenus I77R1B]|uniref:CRISPR-associated endonuclease Cas1 n=2 Tax=Caldicellulosiruptor acetigenus TaxID=301953 RepID=G2PYP8_9FIRM|nr:type I-B CRISPR-associated endonuclease Cas1b [Caldicellulosiruptor acetigenus]ADQ42002.1 CRISPR-associated protein Cas1 [Caldicellulosiruptor acetigenus I77R1B]AEM74967.1 CRISPR-associated protein Cas1 [Caldicellulosiruptor acetigenus 6A]
MKRPIYIFSDGVLKRKNNTLYFESEGVQKFIPVENTSEIYIFGEVELNKRFLEFLTQSEIILHFFNRYGYYVGSFYPREYLNSGYMILKQAEHYLDTQKRLSLARTFVEGSYKNMRQVLKYYQSRGIDELERYIQQMENLFGSISNINDINTLMAIEGNIRQTYYSAFDLIIDKDDFKFEKRSKRPPKNALNALISFGNSMMYTIVLSEIYRTHLDPRIGYLHTTNFRRFTLNLDVAEIFKPIIVDRLIFSIISKNMLKPEHFEQNLEGIVITDSAKKLFIDELEQRLSTTISVKNIGNYVSYRQLIRIELYKIEKHLMGEKEYQPYVSQW